MYYPLQMLLLAAGVLAGQAQARQPFLHEKNYFSRPQSPKQLIKQLTDMQLTFLVLFVHREQCHGKCEKVLYDLKSLMEENIGVTPVVLVDCSRNNSVQFCQQQKIKRYPTLRMFNQDFKYPRPIDYDDDEFEREYVQSWIFEMRRAIFDMSPRADAFAYLFNEPQESGSIVLIYLSAGPYLPMYMQRYCILAHGKARNIHYPGFDAEMREYLNGTPLYAMSEPDKDQIFALYEGVLYRFDGDASVEALSQWMGSTVLKLDVGKIDL